MADDGRVPLEDNSRSLSRDVLPDACHDDCDELSGEMHKGRSQRSNSNNRHNRGGMDERGRRENGGNEYGTTLYISNLPLETRTEDLRLKFERFGTIDECRVISNPVSKESRGFAFLTFSDLKSSEEALAMMDGKEYDGKVLRVEKAKRSKPHDPTPGQYKGPTGASVKYDQRGRLKQGGTQSRGNGRYSYDRHYESRSDARPHDYHSYDRGDIRSVPDRHDRYYADPYASDPYYDDYYRRGSNRVYDDGIDRRRDGRERPRSRSRDRRERPRSLSPRRVPFRDRSPYERVRRR